MKSKLKRATAWVLSLALIFTFLPVQFALADAQPTIAAGTETVDISSGATTVTVPVTIQDNPGFAGMQIGFEVPTGWSIASIQTGKLNGSSTNYTIFCKLDKMELGGTIYQVPSPFLDPTVNPSVTETTGTLVAAYDGSKDIDGDSKTDSLITANGTICWLVCNVPANAVNGKYEIKVSAEKINNTNTAADIKSSFAFTAGTVTVTGGISADDVTPEIKTQPVSEALTYASTAPTPTALTVAASVTQTEGSVLSYQWYKKANGASDFTEVENATTETLKPDLPAIGKTDTYYCKVTNTYMGETYTKNTDQVTVTYNKAELSENLFTIGSTELTYTGGEQTLSITTALAETEYQISGNEQTNVGDTYKATVSAKSDGNYTGSFDVEWKIKPATIEVTNSYKDTALEIYNNGKQTALGVTGTRLSTDNTTTFTYGYEVTSGTDVVSVDQDGNVTPLKVGEAEVTVTISDASSNYTTATTVAKIKVNAKAPLSDKENLTISTKDAATSAAYTGSAQTVDTFVNNATYSGTADGTADITYTVTDSTGNVVGTANSSSLNGISVTDADTYTVEATYEDNTHLDKVQTTFTIAQKTINASGWSWTTEQTYTYAKGTTRTLEVTVPSEYTGIVSVQYSNNSGENAGTYNATATVSTTNTNYTVTAQPAGATLTINKATVLVPTPKSGLKYTGNEQTGVSSADAAIYTVTNGTGTDSDYYIATAKLIDKDNYEWDLAAANNSNDQTINWVIEQASAVTLTDSKSLRYSNTATQSLTISGDGVADVKITKVEKTDNYNLLASAAADGDTGITYALKSGLQATDKDKTATITVTFNSKNYEESTMTLTVTVIDKNDVSGSLTFADGSSTYNGLAQTYENASYSGTASGTGKITYTYEPATVKDAGSYTVTATYEDDDNYGQKQATFTINTATLTITGGTVTAKNYDGNTNAEVTAVEFSGLQNSETLSAGTDYTVSDANFADANAGTGKTVTFDVALTSSDTAKNYTLSSTSGSATGTINKINQSDAVTITSVTTVKFGETLTLTAEGGNGTGAYSYKVEDVTGSATISGSTLTPTAAGTVTVTATRAADTNYNAKDSSSVEITITQADAPDELVGSNEPIKYSNTAAQTVDLSTTVPTDAGTVSYAVGAATDENHILNTYSVDENGVLSYTLNNGLTYTEGVSATIPVTVTMTNYASKTVDVVITLNDKDEVTVSAEDITKTYDGVELTAADISGTATFDNKAVAGTWDWVDSEAVANILNVNTYKAKVQFTPTDTVNYLVPAAVTITVTINQADTTGEPTYTTITSAGQTLADVDIQAGTLTPAEGKFVWTDASGNVLEDTATVEANTEYTWTFTPDDTNYAPATGKLTPYVYRYVSYSPVTSPNNTNKNNNKDTDKTTATESNDKTTAAAEVVSVETVTAKDGTVTTTTEKSDGSTTVVEEKTDGTVTTTDTTAEGAVKIVEEQPDGTVTTTDITVEGAVKEVEKKTDGTITTTDTAVNGVEAVTVEAPGAQIKATVTIPEEVDTAVVTIPVSGELTAGTVAMDADTGEIIMLSALTEEGLSLKLDSSRNIVLVDNSKSFEDVPSTNWASDAVAYASAHGILVGTSEDTFKPNATLDRRTALTGLARQAGVDTTGGDTWYEAAVNWAMDNNISDGTKLENNISREQLATLLYRAAGSPEVKGGDVTYTDADQISSYAADAIAWATENGILTGNPDGSMNPGGTATRAQFSTVIQRFANYQMKH
jgi:hypothetical protein